MPKRATAVVLSEKEQKGLLQITKRHNSEQQVVAFIGYDYQTATAFKWTSTGITEK